MAAKFLSVAVAVAIGLSAEPARAQGAETEFRARLDAIERERAEGEREKLRLSSRMESPPLLDTKSIQATLRPDDIVRGVRPRRAALSAFGVVFLRLPRAGMQKRKER